MRDRLKADASLFAHKHNVGDVYRELLEKIQFSSSQQEVDYLDASHIARIKEIKKGRTA